MSHVSPLCGKSTLRGGGTWRSIGRANKIGEIWRVWMWLLVLLKLVLPPTFSLSTGVISHFQPLVRHILVQQTGTGDSPRSAHGEDDSLVAGARAGLSNSMLGDSKPTERPDATSAADKAVAGQQVASARGVWLSGQVYLMFVWLLGVIVLTTWLVMKVRQLKARRSKSPDTAALPSLIGSLLSDTARKLNLRRVPDVVFSEGVVSPAVFGTLRAYPNNQ